MLDPASIAVLGGDPAARTLARRAALAGCAVRLHVADDAALQELQRQLREDVAQEVAAGRVEPSAWQVALDAILATTDLDEALTHADLVLDASSPTPEAQRALLMRVGQSCRASAVVAITSGHPDAFMDYLPSPGRLLALQVGATEADLGVVGGVETSAHALEVAAAFARRLLRQRTPFAGAAGAPPPPRQEPT